MSAGIFPSMGSVKVKAELRVLYHHGVCIFKLNLVYVMVIVDACDSENFALSCGILIFSY